MTAQAASKPQATPFIPLNDDSHSPKLETSLFTEKEQKMHINGLLN